MQKLNFEWREFMVCYDYYNNIYHLCIYSFFSILSWISADWADPKLGSFIFQAQVLHRMGRICLPTEKQWSYHILAGYNKLITSHVAIFCDHPKQNQRLKILIRTCISAWKINILENISTQCQKHSPGIAWKDRIWAFLSFHTSEDVHPSSKQWWPLQDIKSSASYYVIYKRQSRICVKNKVNNTSARSKSFIKTANQLQSIDTAEVKKIFTLDIRSSNSLQCVAKKQLVGEKIVTKDSKPKCIITSNPVLFPEHLKTSSGNE